MDKINLEQLAPYLPYGLLVKSKGGTVFRMSLTNNMKGSGVEDRTIDMILSNGYTPLLRPLSQLSEEITHNGESFIPMSENDPSPLDYTDLSFDSFNGREVVNWNTPYITMQLLFKWHFDVFGLIKLGIAIEK